MAVRRGSSRLLVLVLVLAIAASGCGDRSPMEEPLPWPGSQLNRSGLEEYYRGRLAEAAATLRRAREESAALDDLESKAHATYNLGLVLRDGGALEGALGELRASESLYRKLGLGAGIARSLAAQATVLALTGRSAEALALCEDALAIAPASVRAEVLLNRAGLHLAAGEIEPAAELVSEALEEPPNDMVRADALFRRAQIQLYRGQPEEAYRTLLEVAELDRKLQRLRQLAATLRWLARLAQRAGRLDEARGLSERARDVLEPLERAEEEATESAPAPPAPAPEGGKEGS